MQQRTFQFQVQPSSSQLPTQQVQQWPLINPQLIVNDPLIQGTRLKLELRFSLDSIDAITATVATVGVRSD